MVKTVEHSQKTQQTWNAGTIPPNVASNLGMKKEVTCRSEHLELWPSCGGAMGLPFGILPGGYAWL